MTEHSSEPILTEISRCRLPSIRRAVVILVVIALAGILAALVNCQLVDNARQRFLHAWLVAFAFVLSASLGTLFFVLIQHLMRAGWSVVVRRIAEVFCLNIIVVGVLFLPIGWSVWQGDGLIYRWSHVDSADHGTHAVMKPAEPVKVSAVSYPAQSAEAEAAGHDEDHSHGVTKPYLQNTRFLLTWVALFVIWIAMATFYFRNSVAQDKTGDVNRTRKMERWSGVAMILFGFTLTFAAFDLLMTLDAAWFSTMFGVYYFAGCAVAGMSTLLLVVLLLLRLNLVPPVFSDEVQRDLGRLLFAFVFFWGYIGFSQYMLLWYANMPETTGWMVRRGMSTATGYANSWGWLAIVLLFAHFVIPFGGMMSRHVKSSSRAMIFWTVWMLVIHYLDLYWIVIPEHNQGLTISFIETGVLVFMVAVYATSAIWIASRNGLFAVGDPRMDESLTRHAMY